MVEIVEITEVYEDGKLDIKTKGLSVFRILELLKTVPDKLYSGAIVNYPENVERNNRLLSKKVIESMYELHRILKLEKNFTKPEHELVSYDIAHHAGLSLEEEYEFLGLAARRPAPCLPEHDIF